MDPQLTILIPTFEESKTIKNTIVEIDRILKRTSIPFEILVVDDNSPDGTARFVREIIPQYPVRLHVRNSHPGLSEAVVEGFTLARGDVIVVTDADGSHDFTKIPEMYKECASGTDIVIGSRYVKGGGIVDWPIKRRIVSFGANFLARTLFPDIKDPISGFFAVKRDLVYHSPLKPRGYKILLEILGRSYWHTFKEIPYTFTNRKSGESKMRAGTMIDFLYQLFDIAKFPGRSWNEVRRMVKFCAVGVSGIFVNMIVLAALIEYASLPLIGASFVATETSIITNFILNNNISFKDIKSDKPFIYKMFSYNGVAIGGMIINIVVLVVLTTFGIYYIFSNVIGIILAFSWNFFCSRKIVWK